MFTMDIGIDLGTANILIFIKGKGIVLREPAVVAVDRDSNRVLAVGEEARNMIGRTPGNIVAIRPLRDGVIANFDITEAMIRYFIEKIVGKSFVFRPRIMICIPSGVTMVEQRAVQEAQEAIAKAQEAKAQLQAIKEEAARAAEQKQEAEKAVKAAKDEKARLEAEAVKRAAKEKAQKQLAKEKEAARQQRDEAIAKAKAQREAAVLKAREEREAAVAKAKEDRAKAVKKAEEASRAKQDSDKKDDTYSHAATTREIKRRIAEMEAKLSSYDDKKDDR